MYKVRAWAHDTAHKSNFNPWADEKTKSEEDAPTVNDEEQQSRNGGAEQKKPKKPFVKRVVDNLKVIFLRSWLNAFLIFVPAGIAVHAAGINQNVDFALNAIAVIPLAGLLTFATESIAHRTSPTIAALMNVSFGNSVELIIFIIALMQNQIRIVQASLIGSVLANLLLILGMSMTLGGLKYQEQIYDSLVTQMSSSLLVLSSLSLLMPTVFHVSFSNQTLADEAVIKISRGTAIILLIIYCLYLTFQLKSHAYLYEGTPQHVIDEQTQPGILHRMNSSSSSSSSSTTRSTSVSTTSTAGSGSFKRRFKRKAKAKLGRRRHTKIEEEAAIEEEKQMSPEGPAPLPNDIAEASEENGDHQGRRVVMTESAEMEAVSSQRPTPATPAVGRRPFPVARGITSAIRAPPVFRTDSSAQSRARYPANQIRRFNSTPNMSTMAAQPGLENQYSAPVHTASGLSTSASTRAGPTEESEPPISLTTAIILLLASTALVAVCAEFMVSSIEHLVESSPLSEAFVGLIILPIVGNAAEHVTAVVVASKNKLDLALGVALGSSIQIALFITPLIVIIGWIADKGMSLYFTLFETVALFTSVFVVCFLCLDGRSNYLEGTLLCAAYIIIALGAYFFPDSEGQNSFVGGTSGAAKMLL
ncbi:hypothetical protein LTR70_004549 [Exophiala xenobiotica]|uniref:Sodium/calcium exchanger membrane region domain-containing protein n=1 Tax=Lithohypha guttulata TaxID=1690604 RepID=A0ABR0KNW8_9EURO|nr:hypothetical protein LTR24_000479 [Lithohypha guttulata]KAK5320466.1 hypothetical protein LTR70_004549 [Exophiala xenobiotica]